MSTALTAQETTGSRRRVALIFSGFASGGIERCRLTLAQAMIERGLDVDLVAGDADGPLRQDVPPGARVMDMGHATLGAMRLHVLKAEPTLLRQVLKRKMRPLKSILPLRQLPGLVRYFATVAPDAVLSAEPKYSLVAMWAKRAAGLGGRIALSEHVQPPDDGTHVDLWSCAPLRPALQRAYTSADAIVAVSDGLARHLSSHAGIPRDRITTVYNPVVGRDLPLKARGPLDHPWFADDAPPVVLSAGRLHPQKDFATLIRAFARVRVRRPARLMILGAGAAADSGYAAGLAALTAELGITDDVEMPGFARNPFAYMSRAAVFVLSSRYEGLGNVLLEAMACGTAVVSTDCPSGPREILDDGQLGTLVAVGDDAALAGAIEHALDHPTSPERLKARAQLFTVDRAANRYLELLFGRDLASEMAAGSAPALGSL